MRELREVKGSDNFSNFPTLYNKDKRDEKANFICFFAPLMIINFFFRQLTKKYRKFATSY